MQKVHEFSCSKGEPDLHFTLFPPHQVAPLLNAAPTVLPRRPSPALKPIEEEQDSSNVGGSGWVVVVYNNEVNTWDQVVGILMKATACTEEEADIETWEIDRLGKSVVHHGGEEMCQKAASIIRTIGIQVEVMEA